ncbi:hypothetical protein LOCC1_G008575 [Lachnellula occidentalis]|uniref:Flavin-nucleotide-binding protein n=1 Tax=Lachnellula occidentalis TaxID=215460 RepID=A0A8H8RET2_9HELO|nr:hypothetical protein LOCC1_G008575 [Lachnellula occidentalis]
MGSFSHPSASLSEPLDLYLHGYVSSRIMNLTSSSTSSSPKGLPVCICASKVDGLVLSLTPYSHNYNYRSAVLFGHASLVEDAEEKLWAMELVTNSVVPDRWRHTRVPPIPSETQSTRILRITIASGSAKIREGVPEDSAADMRASQNTDTIWTGVLPLYEQYGEPVPGPYNAVAEVPEHVRVYGEESSRGNREYAVEAAGKRAPVKVKVGDGDGDEDEE